MHLKTIVLLAASLLSAPAFASTCSIAQFGAVGDGKTDNTLAIQNTFNHALAQHCTVVIPEGRYAYSATLTANAIFVQGQGVSSVLVATNPAQEALILTGNHVSASNFAMTSSATTRLLTPQSALVLAQSALNYSVANLLITGSASNGIMSYGSVNGAVTGNTIRNTLADAITQVAGSHDITVSENKIVKSGDDGISNVSYANSPVVYNITVVGNNISNNLGGRGMSVVGGTNISFIGNYVDNPDKFCDMYIAAESEYSTLGVQGVTVNGNVFVHGGPNQGTVTIYNSQGTLYNIEDVTVTNNQFNDPAWVAVQLVGNGVESGITLTGNSAYSGSSFLATNNGRASFEQSNNAVAPVSSYAGPSSGGCNFTGC